MTPPRSTEPPTREFHSTAAQVIAVCLSVIAGVLAVAILSVVDPWTDAAANWALAGLIPNPAMRLGAVAGPFAEECVTAFVILATAGWALLLRLRVIGPPSFSLPTLCIIGAGTGFAILETLVNGDGGWTAVTIRAVFHSVFIGCTIAGLCAGMHMRRHWLIPAGLLLAIVLHGISNALVFAPLGDLKLYLFALSILALCAATWRFRRTANVWPPVPGRISGHPEHGESAP